MKKFFIFNTSLIVFGFLLSSCCDAPICIPIPKPDCICTLEYAPVCGCDGQTYGNACAAACNSIYLYTPGECDC